MTNTATCEICPHHCELREGQTGFCRGRKNIEGRVTCSNYGKVTSMAFDPIEKKPLRHFEPGSMIFSVGSYGCNLTCPFCQNSRISMGDESQVDCIYITPHELIEKAQEFVPRGNIGIAYTYNEPLISFEYILSCCVLAKSNGLKNVLVTNGYVCQDPLLKLLPYVDAMNIDLKGFTQEYYEKLKGDLQTVKQTIEICAQHCHVEVTTLIIPGENDREDEIRSLAQWLGSINQDIPLHLSRFYPQYNYSDKSPTPVDTIYALSDIAKEHLKHVYTGNC